MALKIAGRRDRLQVAGRIRLARRTHLGKARKVGVPENLGDIGMGNEAPLAVDHVGGAAPADPDARNHIPDELEIDLGHADAGRRAVAADGNGHIGLRLLAEIDRPEPHSVRNGLGEPRIARVILPAADDVHRQTGDPELLMPAAIELRELGDGRHLAQEALGIKTALFKGSRIPRQLRGPADLIFDLANELADLAGSGRGLLVLQADEKSGLLLLGKPDLHQSAHQQGGRYHRPEKQRIFAEQPPLAWPSSHRGRCLRRGDGALRHSNTSSASASSDGGTARPSASAVLRLRVRSNFVGC